MRITLQNSQSKLFMSLDSLLVDEITHNMADFTDIKSLDRTLDRTPTKLGGETEPSRSHKTTCAFLRTLHGFGMLGC